MISKAPRWPFAARIVPWTIGNSVMRGGVRSSGRVISTLMSRCSLSRFEASIARSSRP